MVKPRLYGAIIIDPASFLLLVNTAPILDWPATGTACELAPVGVIATMTPAFGRDAVIPGTPHFTLTVNVIAGSIGDNLLEQFTSAFWLLRRPLAISASRSGQPLFNTIKAIPSVAGPLTFSVDTQPARSWQFTLRLDVPATAGTFVVRSPLTSATVRSFADGGRGRIVG
jgi:hypothetical protein